MVITMIVVMMRSKHIHNYDDFPGSLPPDDAAEHINNYDDFSGSLPPLRVEPALDSDQRSLPRPHHLPPQQALQVQHYWRFWRC